MSEILTSKQVKFKFSSTGSQASSTTNNGDVIFDSANKKIYARGIEFNGNDTNTWRGIQDNLTSDSATDSLSAKQGKALKGLIDGKANSSHTHYSLSTEGNNRSVATTPNDYNNKLIFKGLKERTTISSPSNDTYSYLLGLRGWSDNSGGKSWELAFNNTGIFARMGSTTAWEDWHQLAYKSDFAPVSHGVHVESSTAITFITSKTVDDISIDAGLYVAPVQNVPLSSTNTKTGVVMQIDGQPKYDLSQSGSGYHFTTQFFSPNNPGGTNALAQLFIRNKVNGLKWTQWTQLLDLETADSRYASTSHGTHVESSTAMIFRQVTTPEEADNTKGLWVTRCSGQDFIVSGRYDYCCLIQFDTWPWADPSVQSGGANWITQLCSTTEGNMYYRNRRNGGAWQSWKQFIFDTDSRLTDSRTPKSHTHGNITNDGKVGSDANKPLITTTNGTVTTGSFGTTANTFCAGDDGRLSYLAPTKSVYDPSDWDSSAVGQDAQGVKWFSGLTKTSNNYAGRDYGFPASNNANGVLWLGTHQKNGNYFYGGQLGVSSNGNLYYRFTGGTAFSTTTNGGSWNQIAYIGHSHDFLNQISVTSDADAIPSGGNQFAVYKTTDTANGTTGKRDGGDGFIMSFTWTETSSYGAQIYVDVDPTNILAVRTRQQNGTWLDWKHVEYKENLGDAAYKSLGYTTSGNNRAVQADSNGKLFVTQVDTNSVTHLYATTLTGTANATTTNATTYLRVFDGTTARDSIKIVGAGGTVVTATGGVITIDSSLVSGSGTSSSGIDSFPEGKLTWGGKNYANGCGPLDAALIPSLGANRFCGLSTDVSFGYIDTGSAVSATQKQKVLNDTARTWMVEDVNRYKMFTDTGYNFKQSNVNYASVVLMHFSYSSNVYTHLQKFAINVATNGSTDCTLTIRGKKFGGTTWTTLIDGASIEGWTGWNIITLTSKICVGTNSESGSSSNYEYLEFAFCYTSSSTTANLQVQNLFAYGGFGWREPSYMATYGTPYVVSDSSTITFDNNWKIKFGSSGNYILTSATTSDSKLYLLGQTSTSSARDAYKNENVYMQSGSVYATAFYASSDASLKYDISPISDDEKIPEIKKFKWKENDLQSYGFIAQELEKDYPELVSSSVTKDEYKRVDYDAALALVVGKLMKKIEKLEKRIEELENR